MDAVTLLERYRFGSFELQPAERRLLRDGAAVPLRPRAFDLLLALVDRAGHLVTKDELLDQAWREGSAMTLDDAVRYALDERARRDS